jgi:hypothetical protein
MDEMKLPTFLVIGAMRSGTTTLYYSLLKHPQVFLANIKETNFFTFHDGYPDLPLTEDASLNLAAISVTTRAAYEQLFRVADSALAVGEVSPSYLYSRGAATRIRSVLPAVQLVALLRDPVDRAYSAYLRRAGAVDDPEAFVRAATGEQLSLERGERLPLYPLIQGGLYAHHLGPYLKEFPRNQLWVRLFEDFWSDEKGMLELQRHLRIEHFELSSSAQLNRSGISRSQTLDRLLRSSAEAKTLAKRVLPPRMVRSLVNVKQKAEDWNLKPPLRLPSEIRGHLLDRYFEADIRKLEPIVERDLRPWLAH